MVERHTAPPFEVHQSTAVRSTPYSASIFLVEPAKKAMDLLHVRSFVDAVVVVAMLVSCPCRVNLDRGRCRSSSAPAVWVDLARLCDQQDGGFLALEFVASVPRRANQEMV